MKSKNAKRGRMRFVDTVMNRPGDEMQCEETADWLHVGAGLLSLAKLVTLLGKCNINYATFQHLKRML
jgi:hypothetical protein